MLKYTDIALTCLVTGLGGLFLSLTPLYAGSFVSRGGVEYMGAVLFLVFLGLINLARIQSQHPSARALAIVANGIALAYLVLVSIAVQDLAAMGVSLPVLALVCTSWMNRMDVNPQPSTTAQP